MQQHTLDQWRPAADGVPSHFETHAAEYAASVAPFFAPAHCRAVEHACAIGATDLADVGCGDGRVAAELAARGLRVVGIDSSSSMLQLAADRSAQVTWRCEPAERLGLQSGQFDLVLCLISLPLFQNPAQGLAECVRIARPRGRVLVTTIGGLRVARRALAGPAEFVARLLESAPFARIKHVRFSETFAIGDPDVVVRLIQGEVSPRSGAFNADRIRRVAAGLIDAGQGSFELELVFDAFDCHCGSH